MMKSEERIAFPAFLLETIRFWFITKKAILLQDNSFVASF